MNKGSEVLKYTGYVPQISTIGIYLILSFEISIAPEIPWLTFLLQQVLQSYKPLEQWFSNKGLDETDCPTLGDSVSDLGWVLRIYICSKFSSVADAARPGPPLEYQCFGTMCSTSITKCC